MADIYVHIKITNDVVAQAAKALYEDRWSGDPTEGQFASERLDDCERIALIVLQCAADNMEVDAHL